VASQAENGLDAPPAFADPPSLLNERTFGREGRAPHPARCSTLCSRPSYSPTARGRPATPSVHTTFWCVDPRPRSREIPCQGCPR